MSDPVDPFDVRRLFIPPGAAPPPAAATEPAAVLIPPLRERYRRFVLEYVIDLNGSAAAVRAGYARGKAGGRASELLRRPEVQIAIREEMKERDKRLRLTSERLIREIMCIAFADPARIAHWGPDGVELVDSGDLAPDDRAAVKWISVGGRKGAHAQRFEMHDKLAALELLARLTGLLTRAPGHGRFAFLDNKTPEDLAAEKAEHERNMAKLQRLVDAKAIYLADEKIKAMKAAEAAARDAAARAAVGAVAESGDEGEKKAGG